MNSSGAVANGIGQPVRRKEDFRLLTGKGSFADEIQLPGLAHAVIVRSPHAHAHIRSVDKAGALACRVCSPCSLATTTSPMGSRLSRIVQGSWVRRMSPCGFEAPARLRREINRFRLIGSALSASHLGTCPPCSGRLAVPAL